MPIALEETNGFAFSAAKVLEQITPQTRLMIVNSPANPTGGVIPRQEIETLVEGLAAHPQVAVLSDEIYSQMLYEGRRHTSFLQYPQLRDRLVMLDGFSKTYAMTGWRLGYGVWPSGAVEQATRFCVNVHSCVNTAVQYAGIAALEGPQEETHRMLAAFDTRRRAIVRGLNGLSGVRCADAAGAFYAFPNITATGLRANQAQNLFLERGGVATVAGTAFGAWGEGFVRFSYANSLDNIQRALARIGDVLAEHHARPPSA